MKYVLCLLPAERFCFFSAFWRQTILNSAADHDDCTRGAHFLIYVMGKHAEKDGGKEGRKRPQILNILKEVPYTKAEEEEK